MNFPSISGIQALSPLTTPQLAPLTTPQPLGTLPTMQPPGRVAESVNLLRDAGRAMGVQASGEESSFESLFQAYLDMVNSAGRIEATAQHLQVEYALGNHDDMLAVILAQEMAYTSLYFAVQVTNRIIEAYREIMRMQI